ncbi:MAG TPA: nickel-dependent hydrogenase large subunit [Solirubrobacteraceae bacterium]|nr:nickel-dependent hydrogenase large subunit [Solirubrobacteraceae bacterium]
MSVQTFPAPATGVADSTAGSGGRNLRFEPVTRVSGGLALHASADFTDSRTVRDAAVVATTFRGYEVILSGRDARDAVFVSSRACGVCGNAHATCAALAVEMACGVEPPPMAIAARNLLAAAECLIDHPSHLFLRAGPDYSEPVVRATSPELWTRAEATPAAGAAVHGLARVSDIMTELTRNSGALYREALHLSRVAREAYVLIGGKYPHPQTITPGGVSSTVDTMDFNLALLRAVSFLDYSRRVVAVWDDITDFFHQADARYAELGAGPRNFIDLGLWDNPRTYDASFGNVSSWGKERWSTPGAIVDGVLQTTDLRQIDAGVEEFVDHSFYEGWSGAAHSHDVDGNPLSQHHPANKQTLPRPGDTNFDGSYSWSTAARWRGHPMETGAQARMWATALAPDQPHGGFVESTGRSVRLNVPPAQMPASVLEWQVPERWNAFERNRARAYALAQATLAAYENVVVGLDLARKGGANARIFTPYKIPKDAVLASGYWGGARGYVSHHMQIDGRVIENYQIVGPSTFAGSPRDAAGNPGPCEAAVMATPLVTSDQSQHGIDVLRTIRSFDLCMFCATQ